MTHHRGRSGRRGRLARLRRQAGFTLTEMMVVVSIIGVLVTMAIVYMRSRSRPIDIANRVGDLVREASRRAVALGPVRSDVAVGLGTKARTQITATATTTAGVTGVVFTLWRLQENPLPANTGNWVSVLQYTTDPNVSVAWWASGTLSYAASHSNVWTAWSASPPPLQCKPDSTCNAVTFYFQAATTGPNCDPAAAPGQPVFEQCAKLSVLPLGGAISTQPSWN